MRRVGLGVLSILLALTLLLAAGAVMLRYVVADPGAVKGIIARSGSYDHAVDTALDNLDEKSSDIPHISLKDPEVRSAVKQAYPPDVIRTNIETVIDGTYRWLNGAVAEPDFSLDLVSQKQTLIDGLAAYGAKRAAGLPVCTLQQLQTLDQLDIWGLPCLPPGAHISQLEAQAKTKLATAKFLPEQRITADTLKESGSSQNVFEKAPNAPQAFQSFKSLLWPLVTFCVVFAALIVFLSPTRWRGLRRVGKIMVISAVLIMLIGASLYYVKSSLQNGQAVSPKPLGEDIIVPLLAELGRAAGRAYLLFGAIILAIGVPLWILSRRHVEKPV